MAEAGLKAKRPALRYFPLAARTRVPASSTRLGLYVFPWGRRHAEQGLFLPCRPQRHPRIAQPAEVEREDAARRRIFVRRAQMQLDQRDDIGMRKIIPDDPPACRAAAQFSVSPGSTPHKCTASTKPPRPRTSK